MDKSNEEEIRIEILQYEEYVVLSKKRKPKYKISKEGDKVIANPRSVGKERKWKINGQALYSGMNHNMRSKVIKEIKKYLYQYIRPIPDIINYPISIELEIHNLPGVKNKHGELVRSWDLGNQEFVWMKCFEDALCGNVDFSAAPIKADKRVHYLPNREEYPSKIIDDSVLYITKRICTFVPVNEIEERKLVFKIKQI